MLTRPTTAQILHDIAREVRDNLIPAIDDPALTVNLEMMEQLLTAAAVRAAHEIAWMNEEGDAIVAFARDVAASTSDAATIAALDAYDQGRTDSLHLDDQVEMYSLAGEAFGRALEAAIEPDQRAQGAALIRARRDNETAIRPGFYFPGRA